MFKYALTAATLILPAAGLTAEAGGRLADVSVISVHGSAYGASNGYADRYSAGLFADIYSGALGLHADVVTVDREENGTYGALGVSYRINDSIRPKLLIGTSTKNDSILPNLLISGSIILTPAKGWVITPDVTYRDYGRRPLGRRTRDYTQTGIGVTRYFEIPGDTGGYYAAQVRGEIGFSDTDKNPYSVGVNLQSVRANGLRYGASAEVGYMAWDLQTGAADVQSKMWSVGASIGYRFKGGVELFVRAQHSHNDFYNTDGGTLGLRFAL